MSDILSLLAGLALLLAGGEILVRGATALAGRLGVPPLIIGLTVVAFGTSAPELFVSVQAALAAKGGIAIGNVVGSNLANVLLVLGLPALIRASPAGEDGVGRSLVVMLAASVLFVVMLANGMLGRIEGVVLLAGLALYVFDQIRSSRGSPAVQAEFAAEEAPPARSLTAALALTLVGLALLPLGADFTVDGAVGIAAALGVSDELIGLTIVAVGTSLPELVTSLLAVARGHTQVAIGNVVGSNVFNIFGIMGLSALIAPLAVPARTIDADMWAMLAAALLLAGLAHWRVVVGRALGSAMILSYGLFVALTAHMV